MQVKQYSSKLSKYIFSSVLVEYFSNFSKPFMQVQNKSLMLFQLCLLEE